MLTRTLTKFSLMGALLWAGGTLLLALSITYYIELQMFRQASLASLDFFQAVTGTLPTDAELRNFRDRVDPSRLERAVAPLLEERKAVAIKLYDGSGRLIYHSRDPQQVGKHYPGNRNLERALAGERSFGVTDLSHPENVAERTLGVSQLFEVYLPIRDSNTGAVVGVYEIYTSLTPFYDRLWRQRVIVWGIVLGGALILYVSLFIHFRRASQTILEQSREIGEKAKSLQRALVELKTTQEGLIRSEKLATVGQLAAGIAHEVGNPLGSIMGMADLLLRNRRGGGQKPGEEEYLKRIGSEVMRLKGIIRALLNYARPAEVRPKAVSLSALAEETIRLFRIQERHGSVSVRVEADRPPPVAWADGSLVEQILLNLLLNASAAMRNGGELLVRALSKDPGGGADLRLGPLSKEERNVCVLEVRDNGAGIDPSLLPRIFQPFVTTRSSGEGVGLGLAVSLRLVEELKGAIEVESRLGGGSSFRLFLPSASAASERLQGERVPAR
ncbi:MAG: ATP-binding protein [Nitrospinota bacterium]